MCIALSVSVLTPCFPRFESDYHGLFVKELCDNLEKEVALTVLAPRTRTLGVLKTGYPVNRFPYLPCQRLENLPEATMKGASISRLVELPFYMFSAYKALSLSSPSVIHTHLAIPLGFFSSLVNKPSLITCHCSDLTFPLERRAYLPFTKKALKKTSRVVTVSRYLQNLACKLGSEPKKTETIYLGVDAMRFIRCKKRGALTIGILGRLVPQKNIEDLILAAGLLQERYDIHLRIGGDGPMREYLENYALRLGLESVEFCVVVSDPVQFHQSLDVFVLCSTREQLSISLQEAMSSGVVPVAVNACGCNELIGHGVNGFLFKPRNVPDLVRKLELSFDSGLGFKARKTILDNFDSKINSKKYLKIYSELGHRF